MTNLLRDIEQKLDEVDGHIEMLGGWLLHVGEWEDRVLRDPQDDPAREPRLAFLHAERKRLIDRLRSMLQTSCELEATLEDLRNELH